MNHDANSSAQPHNSIELIDSKFRSRWGNYLLQVCGATLYLGAALLVVDGIGNLAVTSAIAASAFIAFCLPQASMARPRHLLGGHVVALLLTAAISPAIHDLTDAAVVIDLLAALCVGAVMLGMAITNTEHPPAAGTALGLSLEAWTGEAALSILVMVLLLVAVHQLCGRRLMNLF